jgi:hypothetical protein
VTKRREGVQELRDMYSSLNIIRTIKPKEMKWSRHVSWECQEKEITRKTKTSVDG